MAKALKKAKGPKVEAPPNGIGHNEPDEAALREALEIQLIGLRFQHAQVDMEMSVLREQVAEKRGDRKIIREAIQKLGMPLKLFDEALDDARTSRVDLERRERLRDIVRSAFGVAARPQLNLPLEAVYDATHWEAEGYRVGIAGLDPEDQPAPPPEHVGDYQRGLNQATARNAEGLTAIARAVDATAEDLGESAVTVDDLEPQSADAFGEQVRRSIEGD